MDIRDLIPYGSMPVSGLPCNLSTAWWGLDSEEEFRARGGHPTYDESAIEYRFNSHGYRCPEFDEQAAIRMVSIGCGYTAGQGLPKESIFHERFAERLRIETQATVVNWNLGQQNTGNDVIDRVLNLAVSLLDPHVVLVLFTAADQREYMSPAGLHVTLPQSLVAPTPLIADIVEKYLESRGPQVRRIIERIAASTCHEDNELRFFRSYKSIEALLSDRCWLFGVTNDRMESFHAFHHVDAVRYAGSMSAMDLSRDCVLPGPYSHELMYRKFWNRFEALGRSGRHSFLSDGQAAAKYT